MGAGEREGKSLVREGVCLNSEAIRQNGGREGGRERERVISSLISLSLSLRIFTFFFK